MLCKILKSGKLYFVRLFRESLVVLFLKIFLACQRNHICWSVKLKTCHPNEKQNYFKCGVTLVFALNRVSYEKLIIWAVVVVQYFIILDFSDSLKMKGIWTYHSIKVPCTSSPAVWFSSFCFGFSWGFLCFKYKNYCCSQRLRGERRKHQKDPSDLWNRSWTTG